jgi:E3 ubiquitin-protein ligase RNF25
VHLSPAGLSDARLAALQSGLADAAAALAGELALGALVESAIDALTAANWPEGDCAFCLEPLLLAQDATGSRAGHDAEAGDCEQCVRLDCFHCFHL